MAEKAIVKVEISEQLKSQIKLLATVRGLSMTDLIAEVMEAEVQRYPEVKGLQERIQVKEVTDGT